MWFVFSFDNRLKRYRKPPFFETFWFCTIFLPAAGYTLRYEVWWPYLDLEVCGIDSARRAASIGVVINFLAPRRHLVLAKWRENSEIDKTHVNNIEKSCNQEAKNVPGIFMLISFSPFFHPRSGGGESLP